MCVLYALVRAQQPEMPETPHKPAKHRAIQSAAAGGLPRCISIDMLKMMLLFIDLKCVFMGNYELFAATANAFTIFSIRHNIICDTNINIILYKRL